MVKIFRKLDHLPDFDRDLKKLLKRFKTLEEDLEIFINTELNLYHKLNIDNNGIFEITGSGIETPKIFKAKKFACKSLKGKGVKSGIRIIYAYYEDIDSVEFIEIYYKGDKDNEDRKRIKDLYKS
jgi:hypothetical protein